jgi:hypothetical protein
MICAGSPPYPRFSFCSGARFPMAAAILRQTLVERSA